MRSYKFIEHTADAQIFIVADTQEELLMAGLEGMNALLLGDGCAGAEVSKIHIKLFALNITSLLIDFLGEVLTYAQVNRCLYTDLLVNELTETFICAELRGFAVKTFAEDVKAVTYHDANVVQNKEHLFETMVVFDI